MTFNFWKFLSNLNSTPADPVAEIQHLLNGTGLTVKNLKSTQDINEPVIEIRYEMPVSVQEEFRSTTRRTQALTTLGDELQKHTGLHFQRDYHAPAIVSIIELSHKKDIANFIGQLRKNASSVAEAVQACKAPPREVSEISLLDSTELKASLESTVRVPRKTATKVIDQNTQPRR